VVLVDFLRANADIFTWSPSDMPGIPREVAEHSLDILPHSRAVQQRLRHFDEERRRAIGAEPEASRGRVHQGGVPPYVASESCISKEKEREMADVYRLH
jgi:hypothetical protein